MPRRGLDAARLGRALGAPAPAARRLGHRRDRLAGRGRSTRRRLTTVDQRHERRRPVERRAGPPRPGRPRAARIRAGSALSTWNGMRCPAGWPSTSRSASGRCGRPAASPAAPTPASPSAIPGVRSPRPRTGSSRTPREHGIAPMAQVITGSAEEQALRAARLDRHLRPDRRAGRPAGRLAGRPPARRAYGCTRTSPSPGGSAYQQSRPNNADPALLRMILDGNPPRAFAGRSARRRGSSRSPAATSAATGSDWLSIWTRDDHRRRAGRPDDDRPRPLGRPAGRPVRLPAGRLSQRRLTRLRSGSASYAPRLSLSGAARDRTISYRCTWSRSSGRGSRLEPSDPAGDRGRSGRSASGSSRA